MPSNQAIAAGSRGISINLRSAERADAPIAESITLYATSFALVIGNDDYNNGWPKLTNAIKDAELVATELQEKGFDVELHRNLDSLQLNEVFKRFFILKGNDPGARLFVWYAGHGQTLDGEGYLVPVDAPVPSKGPEFKFSAVALRDFGTYMRQALSKHAYAVFDSCFAGSVFSSQRAMPPAAITRATTLPVRQFLTSGDANQTVSDDGSFRGLFIRAVRGEERSDANGDGYVTASELGMFLGDRVTNLTQSVQTPRYGKLRDKDYDRGDFVFVLPEGAAGSSGLGLAPKPAPAQASAEITFWNSIQNSDSIGQFDAYLKQYPNGSFTALAMVRKTELQKKLDQARKAAQAREVFEVAFLDRDFEATKVANVRQNPFPTAEKVARLEKGALVWAIGETQTKGGKWYKVARDGLELGFVYSPLLKETVRVDSEVAVESLPVPEAAVGETGRADTLAADPEAKAAELEPVQAPAQPESTDQRLSSFVDDLLTPAEREQAGRGSAATQPPPSLQTSSNAERTQNVPAAEKSVQPVRNTRQTTRQATSQVATGGDKVSNPAEGLDQPQTAPSVPPPPSVTSANTSTDMKSESAQPVSVAAGTAVKETADDDLRNEVADQPGPTVARPEEPVDAAQPTVDAAQPTVDAAQPTVDAAQPIDKGEPVQTVSQPADRPAVVDKGDATPPRRSAQPEEKVALLQPEIRTSPATKISDYIKQYITAAEGGNIRAQTALAYMYETGQEVEVDKQQAEYWYRQAAEKGDIQAQFNLGLMYQSGDGTQQDLTEAAFWYRKAAIKGDPDAQQTLGYMYENGRGLVKDIAEAAWWYTKAAEQGKVAAQNNLGRLYQLGLGIPKDITKAIFWYGKAAEQGSETARKNLSELTQ